jgi:hypothetical protein
MSESETGRAAEVKPNLGSPLNRPQPIIQKITTLMVLRQVLATPFYVVGLVFSFFSDIFTGIAERIDGSSPDNHP